MRALPFPTVRGYLDRLARKPEAHKDKVSTLFDTVAAGRIVWAVSAMGRRVPGTTCLVEALAAHCMLRRHGHRPALKIGVRRGAVVALDAHAWVECGGAVVIGRSAALTEYAVLSQVSGVAAHGVADLAD